MKGKLSKNRKKGWKKINISEVEDYIEDQRLQERTGGLVADKSDDQLFFIDAPPSKGDSSQEPIVNIRKSRSQPKPLKSFANLEPDPRIPRISNQVKGHSKQNLIKATKPATRQLVQSVEQRKQAIAEKTSARSFAKKIHQEAYDLWSDDSKVMNEHFAKVTKKQRVKVPSTLHNKPSAVAAVEAPHPGSSYNPAFDDHQELLQKVVIRQVKEDVEEARIEKRMKPNYGSEGPPTQESYLKEMSHGLGLNEESDVETDSETPENDDKISVNRPATADKMKTKRQKRKRKERLQEQANKLKEKKARMLEDRNSNDRLRSIRRQVGKHEQRLAERADKKTLHRESLATKTKRLNKKQYEDVEEDVLLTSELKGSMRLTRSNSTLLEERFKSLQKRNIIEPRSRAKFRRRYKPKFTEKKPFKEITSVSRAGGGIIIPFHQRKHNVKE